ncbi:hypothetical protein [Mycobacterium sp. OTB74]|jgi:hypothetical protein|uniref:hypothetical protein n=1 Tax=Mycobacterium sp. OTB74 TaxID=1853452 RepID=UPI0024755039|nr:hypothetical protein [Mycobacterium sp. OTB74]MDH6242480.1 hypothetical protein [Mycobacterium sp. OTB74]
MIRRLLSRRVSVEAMIEFALWLAIPYIVAGLVWTFMHPADMRRIGSHWDRVVPAGSQIVALVEMTALWPALITGVQICPAKDDWVPADTSD